MTSSPKILAFGTVEADADSWLLASEHVIPLDTNLLDGLDGSLEHDTLGVVGTMGIAVSTPPHIKRVVERLARHVEIKRTFYEIHESSRPGSGMDHWLRAQRELLNM
jgi:hypothetical protein